MAKGRERVELRKVCEARYAETCVYAREILRWIREFGGGTPEVRDILRFWGALRIFKADFVYPMAPSSLVYTVILLQSDDFLTRWPVLNCVLWRNETRLDEFTLGQNEDLGRELILRLHPDFLRQWYEEIKSGKIWKYIESSLM
jgi:hypothetical protein